MSKARRLICALVLIPLAAATTAACVQAQNVAPHPAATSSAGATRSTARAQHMRSPATRHPHGLHVVGRQIDDARGRAIRLLGVNRSGSEFECIQGGAPTSRGWGIFDGPVDPVSARAIAAWGANVVRIPLNEDCWLGLNGVNATYGGAAYRKAIVSYVHVLHEAGLYVILDLHWSAPAAVPAQSQQPMPDSDHSPAFWRSVASTFRRDGDVAFDLYNEPFLYSSYLANSTTDAWTCWLDGCNLSQYLTGGSPYTKALTWHAAGMQALVQAVRSTGARNLILVAGLDWANDLSGWAAHEPSDPIHNLAVSWHSYPGEACSTPTCWNQNIAPLARMVPVVVGETGDNVCSHAAYEPSFLSWADNHNLSYVGWTWNTWSGDCKNILIQSYAGTPTANYGRIFHDHLTRLAHRPASTNGPAPALHMPPLPPLFAETFHGDRVHMAPRGWQIAGGRWVVARDGNLVIRQNTVNQSTSKVLFRPGSWSDYSLSTRIKTFSTTASIGIAGRCIGPDDCYVFILHNGDGWYLGRRNGSEWASLASGQFSYSTRVWYRLGLQFTGPIVSATVNGRRVISVRDTGLVAGGIALLARSRGDFARIWVKTQ